MPLGQLKIPRAAPSDIFSWPRGIFSFEPRISGHFQRKSLLARPISYTNRSDFHRNLRKCRVLEKKMSSFKKNFKSISNVRKKFPKLDIFFARTRSFSWNRSDIYQKYGALEPERNVLGLLGNPGRLVVVWSSVSGPKILGKCSKLEFSKMASDWPQLFSRPRYGHS